MATLPSFIDLCATVSKEKEFGDAFSKRMHTLFRVSTCPVYNNMARYEGDSECIWVDFENWKTQGVKQLEMMWKELKWEVPAQASQAALHRSETHKNREESFKVVSPDLIRSELGQSLKKCVEKCAAYGNSRK